MPLYSETRKTHLYTVAECAALLSVTEKTIRRYLERPFVYTETHSSTTARSRGASRTLYIDILTLGVPVSLGQDGNVHPKNFRWTDQMDNPTSDGQEEKTTAETPETDTGTHPLEKFRGTLDMSIRTVQTSLAKANPEATVIPDLTGAQEWFELLQPALKASKWKRAELVKVIAAKKNCSTRSIYRKLEALESSQNGLSALAKKPRADKGHFRIAQDAYEVILGALLSNTSNTSVRYVHRTLIRAVPQVMTYETSAGKHKVITVEMVRRVKNAMLQDPVMRLAFFDTTERKEFMRTYNGKVTANHANHMWQMDMTRCDVEVVDPETQRFVRLRVHAIIDVYSGVIPGIAFSEDEDQTQTDLAFLRAILPKQGPYANKYPIFGVPEIMYWDNGKTYKSEHIERILKGLNTNSIHSIPLVSHTRGAIERFWRTLHGFEKTLAGYVGENAKDRDSEELRNLRKVTLKWLQTGTDPGFGKRHLTIDEFKGVMLAWIISEYHQWVVDGKTRLQHFLETVPAKTQLLFDPTELFLLFAKRKERTVTPDGGVKVDGRLYKIPNGMLAPYSGMKVLVLEDQFSMGDVRVVVRPERNGQLTILGEAIPAPENANSIAAGEQRRADKAANRTALNSLKEVQERLSHPDLIVAKQILKELDVAPTPAALPATPAPLPAVNPPKADLGQFGNFLKPSDTTDIDAFMSEINLPERKKP